MAGRHRGFTLPHLRYLLPCPADPTEQGLTRASHLPTLQDHEGAGKAASLPRGRTPAAGRRSGEERSKGSHSHGPRPSPAALLLPAPRKLAFQHCSPPRRLQPGQAVWGLQTGSSEPPAAAHHVTAPAPQWAREDAKLNYLRDPFGSTEELKSMPGNQGS